jgi:ferredoxin
MKVWIDQELCTGDGLCEELCPSMFVLGDDGLAYLKEGELVHDAPGGHEAMVAVPDELADAVRDAADQCAGECIFVEA